MLTGFLLIIASAWPLMARAKQTETNSKSLKIFAYGPDGKLMDLRRFLQFIGKPKMASADSTAPAIFAVSTDGSGGQKPSLRQSGPWIELDWENDPKILISLVWPIAGDGFSTVMADHGSSGFSDGDAVYLNEEIAFTQYRFFRDAWLKHSDSMSPRYKPSAKARRMAKKAETLIFKTKAAKSGAARAAQADKALRATALAWEMMLFEHGEQIARDNKERGRLRFGITLDASIRDRLPDYRSVIAALKNSGVNWARVPFAKNPADFTYSRQSSFDVYDAIVGALKQEGIHVMGCVLDSAEWPDDLTPTIYARRTKNLALHYSRLIRSWEVGNEINGDWLGGIKRPLSLDQAFQIYRAGAAQAKAINPDIETVATLYWWGPTAPDFAHSTQGWLSHYASLGFGKNLDVAALSLEPADNPVGVSFETAFDLLSNFLPDKTLMLGDFEYGESSALKGYWWLKPGDVQAAREDLTDLYTPAACAMPQSVCGGFFWYALEQMLPPGRKPTPLFRAYQRALAELSR
ncbi:MAG: glycoside hydrolase family protein [Elusimicrobiota bacterium]